MAFCKIYFACSLDGFIAGPNNELDWLEDVPNPDGADFGFEAHMASIDALLMGRSTFDTVSQFRPWPYDKPVMVASNHLQKVDDELADSVHIISGSPAELIAACEDRGYQSLYVDGGQLATSFLAEGLIDEMVISWIPILLGGGIRLFGELPELQWWHHSETVPYPGGLVQSTYRITPTH